MFLSATQRFSHRRDRQILLGSSSRSASLPPTLALGKHLRLFQLLHRHHGSAELEDKPSLLWLGAWHTGALPAEAARSLLNNFQKNQIHLNVNCLNFHKSIPTEFLYHNHIT